MLEYAHQPGLPVTIGSDARQTEQLGQYLDLTRAALQEVGYTRLTTINCRKILQINF